MQATRILPDLQCSLLCEEIRQEITGNFFLIGVINFIRVPQLPVVALKLSLFNRWTAGSFLAAAGERKVTQIALNLLEGAAVATRAHQARIYGVPVPAEAFTFIPRRLC